MNTYAVIRIEDNIVDNVVIWDGVTEWQPPANHVLQQLDDHLSGGIGWQWDPINQIFIDVRPPVPECPLQTL